MKPWRGRRFGALAAVLWLAACATPAEPPRSHEKLDAVLWMRTSAEWVAAAEQVYATAADRLEEALDPANAEWTAALEQTGDFARLPPALIIDIDEAILDNSEFAMALVEAEGGFHLPTWKDWVRQKQAVPVPGAVDFLERARKRGVRVFYVTNRAHDVEAATVGNLRQHGFPVEPGGANLLSRDEREDWDSDKTSRRAFVAASHRVVLIIGDDLNDFVSGSRSDAAARVALARRHAAWWGRRWILLPNPVYGSWEGSLYGFDRELPREEILRLKYEALDEALH